MDDVRVADTRHHELLVPHVQHLTDTDARKCVAVRRDVVQEQLEVTHHHELAHPTLLHASGLRNLHIALVRSADTPRRVYP